MITSDDLLRDVRPSQDKVRIVKDSPIDIQRYCSLTIVFPNEAGGITVKLHQVAHVPDLAFNLLSLVVSHNRGVRFVTNDDDMNVTLDARLKFRVKSLATRTMARGLAITTDPLPIRLLVPDPVENLVQTFSHPIFLAFVPIAPATAASRESFVDINVSHLLHGHVDEPLPTRLPNY